MAHVRVDGFDTVKNAGGRRQNVQKYGLTTPNGLTPPKPRIVNC
jgi:hypothetical protein